MLNSTKWVLLFEGYVGRHQAQDLPKIENLKRNASCIKLESQKATLLGPGQTTSKPALHKFTLGISENLMTVKLILGRPGLEVIQSALQKQIKAPSEKQHFHLRPQIIPTSNFPKR